MAFLTGFTSNMISPGDKLKNRTADSTESGGILIVGAPGIRRISPDFQWL
ncbi:hypothetical protein [Alteromonas sp. 1_MG-2023]|nr:hypothetical protein [Alteromonas sp. 1_MG-2023]